MDNPFVYYLISFIFIISIQSCGKDNETQLQQNRQSIQEEAPAEYEYEPVNADIDGNKVVLKSYRYRQNYDYNQGVASVIIPESSNLNLSKDKIKVYIKVDEDDFERVEGLKLKGSEQPWSQLRFRSSQTGSFVKLCLQIQPKATSIDKFGLIPVELNKKKIFTVVDDNVDCVGVKSSDENVFSGIVDEYLIVDSQAIVEAETKGDMKAGSQRVGTQIEFEIETEAF